MHQDSVTFYYTYETSDQPLDLFVAERYLPSNQNISVEEIINHRLTVNGMKARKDMVLSAGDKLGYQHYRSDEDDIEVEINVIYEDKWYLAISKPDHVPVSPSGRYYFKSLAIYAKDFFQDADLNPLHRLDIETSGVLLFGKNRVASGKVQKQFERKKVSKLYQAITFGPVQQDVIAGKMVPAKNSQIYTKQELDERYPEASVTHLVKQERWGDYYQVWLKPITGKTNQLRVHLASVGAPIVGDKKYYPDESVFMDWFYHRDMERLRPLLKLDRQALHCSAITFLHPFLYEELTLQDTSGFWEKKISNLI